MQAHFIQPQPPTSFLVVDDDPENRELLVRLLGREGHTVTEAASGEQALKMARAQRPGIVLLDVVLPDLNGIEVCRRLKADRALAGTFVVLISSNEISSDSKVVGLYQGADDYLVRPLPARELRARLQTLVRLHRAEAALRESSHFGQQLIAGAGEGIVVFDRRLRCRVWNPFLEELFGVHVEQVRGQPPEAVFPQFKHLGISNCIQRALAGEAVSLLDVPLPLPGHTLATWVVARLGPLCDAAGEIIGVLGTIHDVTQRRGAVVEMQRRHDDVDHLMAAHTAELEVLRWALADETAARQTAEAALQAAWNSPLTAAPPRPSA